MDYIEVKPARKSVSGKARGFKEFLCDPPHPSPPIREREFLHESTHLE